MHGSVGHNTVDYAQHASGRGLRLTSNFRNARFNITPCNRCRQVDIIMMNDAPHLSAIRSHETENNKNEIEEAHRIELPEVISPFKIFIHFQIRID